MRMLSSRSVGAVLFASSFVVLAACSGGSPSTTAKNTTTTARPPAKATAAPCSSSSVSASVDFTQFGGSSPAGAVVFRDTGDAPCVLRGVPDVAVLAPDGQSISTYQAGGPAQLVTAVLTPGAPSGTGTRAASSITFSDWACAVGSFSLTVRFPGWASSIPAGGGAGSTTSTTTGTAPTTTTTVPAPCSQARETGQTLYMGPVTAVTG